MKRSFRRQIRACRAFFYSFILGAVVAFEVYSSLFLFLFRQNARQVLNFKLKNVALEYIKKRDKTREMTNPADLILHAIFFCYYKL